MNSLVKSASEIARGFSTLEIYAGRGEPTGDMFGATKSLAEGTVGVVNRATREHMQDAYALR